MNVNTPHIDIAKRWAGAGAEVVRAIESASKRTGVSFEYLMDKAKQESSFDAAAKAGTSSARGLYQFIESTWLNAVRNYGSQFGLGQYANKISADGTVSDKTLRAKILKLRDDPAMAANMAAAMTRDNARYLEKSLGGKMGETDLYLAHFLGTNGAEKFLRAKTETPNAMAADLFPAAAKANKNVFYDQSGKKRSLDDVYAFFAGKMNDADTTVKTPEDDLRTVVAARPETPRSLPVSVVPSLGQTPTIRPDISDALNAIAWGHRQLLDSLVSGVSNYTSDAQVRNGDTHIIGGNLLSPYTAFVMSKLKVETESQKS